ncbi:MAG: hypothetical protein ABJC87_10930 [Roseobacter sp.]
MPVQALKQSFKLSAVYRDHAIRHTRPDKIRAFVSIASYDQADSKGQFRNLDAPLTAFVRPMLGEITRLAAP